MVSQKEIYLAVNIAGKYNMPQAIPLVLGAAVSSAGLTAIPLIIANLVVAAISNALVKAGLEKADRQEIKQMVRTNSEPKTILYGEAIISGPILYMEAHAKTTGNYANFLDVAVVLTGHPVEEIVEVFLDDNKYLVTDLDAEFRPTDEKGPWTRIFTITGQDSEDFNARALRKSFGPPWCDTASLINRRITNLEVLNCTSKVKDASYIGMTLRFNPEIWSAIPNLKARVKGKLVRDSVDMYNLQQSAQDPMSSIKRYSTNWSDCVLDYLMDPYIGLGTPVTEIDLLFFRNAALLSDESVETAIDSGVFINRYTCNGIEKTDNQPIGILENMLTAGFGTLVYTQGKYRLYGGEYTIPLSASEDIIVEDDLAGPVKIRVTVPRQDRFSAVRGTYIDADKDFTVSDFPEVSNPLYKVADAGSDNYIDPELDGYIYRDITLPFTNDVHIAQRLAKLTLDRARQAILLELSMKPKGIRYSVGDNVKVNFPTLTAGIETNVNFSSATLGLVIITSNSVTSVGLTTGGSGYNYPPEITFSGGGGEGAGAITVIDQGVIVAILITSGGTGYTSTPSVILSNPVGNVNAWTDKVFKVEEWKPKEDGTITLILHEDAEVIYVDNETVTADSAPDIGNEPAVPDYAPSRLQLDTGAGVSFKNAAGVWVPRIKASFTPAIDPNLVDHYEIQLGDGSASSFPIQTIQADAVTEDPVSSDRYTAIINIVLDRSIESIQPYAEETNNGAVADFNFLTPLPLKDSENRYADLIQNAAIITTQIAFPTWASIDKGVRIELTGALSSIFNNTTIDFVSDFKNFSFIAIISLDSLVTGILFNIQKNTGGSTAYPIALETTASGDINIVKFDTGGRVVKLTYMAGLTVGTPVHIAYTERGPGKGLGFSSNLYVNGQKVASTDIDTVYIGGTPDQLLIGKEDPDTSALQSAFLLGNLRLYNVSLSESQISSDYLKAIATDTVVFEDIQDFRVFNIDEPEFNGTFAGINEASFSTNTTASYKILDANLKSSFLQDDATGFPPAKFGHFGAMVTFSGDGNDEGFKILSINRIFNNTFVEIDRPATFAISDTVSIRGVIDLDSLQNRRTFQGTHIILSAPSATMFEYANIGPDTTGHLLTGAFLHLNYPKKFSPIKSLSANIVDPAIFFQEVTDGEEYVIRLRSQNIDGVYSQWIQDSIIVEKDLGKPSPIFVEAIPTQRGIEFQFDFEKNAEGGADGPNVHLEKNLSHIELVICDEDRDRFDGEGDPGSPIGPNVVLTRIVKQLNVPTNGSDSNLVQIRTQLPFYQDYYYWARLVTTSGIASEWFPNDSGEAALRDRFNVTPVLIGKGPIRPNNGSSSNLLPIDTGDIIIDDTSPPGGTGGDGGGFFPPPIPEPLP